MCNDPCGLNGRQNLGTCGTILLVKNMSKFGKMNTKRVAKCVCSMFSSSGGELSFFFNKEKKTVYKADGISSEYTKKEISCKQGLEAIYELLCTRRDTTSFILLSLFPPLNFSLSLPTFSNSKNVVQGRRHFYSHFILPCVFPLLALFSRL